MDDAELWLDQGYTADELTEDDILNEYPDDYFDADENEETDEFSFLSTPHDWAAATLDCLRELAESRNE